MRGARLLGVVALVASSWGILAGCSHDVEGKAEDASTAAQAPAYGDTFITASIGDISGLIPSLTTDAASHEIGSLIYDGLVRIDKDLNNAPGMAESWTFSKDCLDLTFKLRRDVKWHDGRPFTADDVIFTYKAMVNPKTPAPFKEGYLLVKG